MTDSSTAGIRSALPAILVADDEQGVRDLLRQILDPERFRILEATNGREVLEAVKQTEIDLVILDLVMPEAEGIETLQSLRFNRPELKVLVISGAFGGSFLRCARALGAHASLKKPFTCEALLDSVNRLLEAA